MTLKDQKVLAIITGASRGIGREIAVQLSKVVGKGSALLLTARNFAQLDQLKTELLKINDGLEILIVVCDAAQLNAGKMIEFEAALTAILFSAVSEKFDALMIIHNAGTIGDISKQATELMDMKQWHDYLQINLISVIQLNNLVLRTITNKVASIRFVVNITSLLAVKGFASFAEYSVGKAAREAFFRCLAVEDKELRVLNYSPGPVLTEMYNEIAEKSYDSATREMFKGVPSEKSVEKELHRESLTPEETVKRMFHIIEENKFESGGRCDYFD